VEHTQMHHALKKGTKNFHYTSNSCGIFVISLFYETKIPMVDMKSMCPLILAKREFEKK
jgi:hypothetical protein